MKKLFFVFLFIGMIIGYNGYSQSVDSMCCKRHRVELSKGLISYDSVRVNECRVERKKHRKSLRNWGIKVGVTWLIVGIVVILS